LEEWEIGRATRRVQSVGAEKGRGSEIGGWNEEKKKVRQLYL